jgi:hypothetical protein
MKILFIVLGVVVLGIAISLLPDFIRYLKLRSM